MSKPREFFINPKGTWLNVTDLIRNDKPGSHTHVIEKSAYDKAIKALKDIIKISSEPYYNDIAIIADHEDHYKIADDTLKELGEVD